MTEFPIILETSLLIYWENRWTGFYKIETTVIKDLKTGTLGNVPLENKWN